MSNTIKWVKDIDTGELFPVPDISDDVVPEHLKDSEYTLIDYDKTREMTIMELQEQLFAAQNQIKVINEEENPITETPAQPIEETDGVNMLQLECKDIKKMPISIDIRLAVVVLLCIVTFILGIFVLVDKDFISFDTVQTVQQVQEAETAAESSTNDVLYNFKSIALSIMSVFIAVLGVRTSIIFLRRLIKQGY